MFNCEQIKTLNDLEFGIYSFIMENKEKVPYMKIRELAQETHVSTTTVLNFCRKLDCEGYSEFKVKLKDYFKSDMEVRVSEDSSELLDFIKKTSNDEFEDKIEKIAEVIEKANRVMFVGSSMSGIVANYGARYLSSVGVLSLSIDDPYYPTTGKFYDDAVVVACSVSGESNDMIDHLTKFRNSNCVIVSITNTENSTIAKMSDFNIAYYVPMVRIGRYDITSQVPAIHIIERIGRKIHNN